jgi:S-adenosylmethionine:diacylglycerol 3-amino-3-carboxypropyl transferase
MFAPLAGWRRSVVEKFLAFEDPGEQMDFWRARLDTWVFRTGLDTMLSRALLRFAYSRKYFDFIPPHFGAVLRGRLERGFARHANAGNPYARALLIGDYSPVPSACSERISFVASDAASLLETCSPGTFDGFTLSNILDGAQDSYRERLLKAVRHAATGDAVVIFRSLAEPTGRELNNRAAQDRSMLWGIVDVRPVASL